MTLRVKDGRIAAIEPETESGAGSSDQPPADRPQAGAAGFGGYVLPGLIDSHVHSPGLPLAGDRQLWSTLYLLHGVTTVRNLGDGRMSLRHKRPVAEGREAGPRILACGDLLDGNQLDGGHGGSYLSRTIRTPAEARRIVHDLKDAGADCIKVLPHFSPEVFAALREAAHAAGLPLVGHMVNAYAEKGLELSGIVDVQHLSGMPLAPSPGMDDDEWRRFRQSFAVLPSARLEEMVALSRRLDIVHTPTLIGPAYEALGARGRGAQLIPTPRQGLLPHWYETLWSAFDAHRGAADRELALRNLPRYLEIVRALHQAGVRVQAGSDTFTFIAHVVPGLGLHEELSLLVRAGFSAEEALAAATTVAGGALSQSSSARSLAGMGAIAVSGPADLLIFREDPTASLAALDSLETVIADGRRYERADLQRHLDLQLERARRFPYSWSARILEWLISLFA